MSLLSRWKRNLFGCRTTRPAAVRYALNVEQLETRLALTTVAVDASAGVHAIDPNIYGTAFATTAQLLDLNATVNRNGGNASDTYNWQVDATNHANDYYYESISEGSGNGQSRDAFVSSTQAGGAQTDMTVSIMPYIAKLGSGGAILGSYPVSVYGAQQSTDPYAPNFGNGVTPGGSNITDTNPLYNYVANSPTVEQAWIQHLISTFGNSSSGGIKYYTLGNEPGLWNSTHRDIHPSGETNTELLNDYINYASMIKSLDPGAKILGPEEWGWTNYFVDGADAAAGNYGATYGGLNVQQWLLQQLHQYQTANGTRLLDYFTLHYYPQGDSSGHQEFSNDVSQATELLRNQSTRSLWDPNYVDQSWIGTTGVNGGKVDLIPMMQSWVNSYYPGTKVGITEYNWGAEGDMNGATTQADVWGIFGRQALDLATRWTTPATNSPTYLAMKLWRNYDGQDHGFGDTSVGASVANPDQTDAFAAIRSSDGSLTVAVINKNLYNSGNPGATTPVTINLSNFTSNGIAQAWQLAAVNPSNQTNAAITRLSDITFGGSSFTVNVPMESVTMFVIKPSTSPVASITSTIASAENTPVNTAFPTPLQVILKDSGGNALSAGINVTYTISSNSQGAGATFAGGLSSVTIATNASGIATAPGLTAGPLIGTFTVTASTPGLANTVTFTLTSTPAGASFNENFSPFQSTLTAANWQVLGGGFSQNGTQAIAGSAANNYATYRHASAADTSVSANVTVIGSGTVGLISRLTGATGYLATLNNTGSSGVVTIFELTPTAFVNLTSATVGQFTSPVTLRFDTVGIDLRVFVNGVLDASVLNTDVTAPGETGIYGTPGETVGTFTTSAATPTLSFNDAFTPNQAALTAGNWQPLQGSFSQSGGQAIAGGGANNFSVYANASATDVSVSAQNVTVVSGGTVGLLARLIGPGGYLATLNNSGSNGVVTIFEVTASAYLKLTSANVGPFTAPVSLRFDVIGNALRVYVNGALDVSVLNADLNGPGLAGIYGTTGEKLGTYTVAATVPALPISDTFTPSQGTLTVGNWQAQTGAYSQNGTQALASAAALNIATNVNAAEADVTETAQNVSVLSGGTVGLVARFSSLSSYYVATLSNSGGNGVVTIARATASGLQTLTSAAVAQFTAPVTLTFTVVGNSLQAFVNGTLRASVLNSALLSPGLVGLYGTSNETFGTFSVSVAVPALPFTDAFSPSQANLAAASWQVVQGGYSQNGTQAVASAAGLNLALDLNSSASDVRVSAQNVSVVSGGTVGLVARYSSSTSYYLATISNSGSNGVVTIFQSTPSGFQVLTSATFAQFTAPVNLVFTVQGNTLEAFANGTLRASVLGAALTGPGLVGLWGTANELFGTFNVAAL